MCPEVKVRVWATDIFSNGGPVIVETFGRLGICLLGHTSLVARMLIGKIEKLDEFRQSLKDHDAQLPASKETALRRISNVSMI